MFLLDTDIVWQLRGVAGVDAAVTSWAARQQRAGLFVSVLALVEFGLAADALSRSDKPAAAALQRWLDDKVAAAFEGRILPVDSKVATRAARLAHANLTDGLVAATAIEHGLTLATRSPAAFKATRAKLVDPRRPDAGGSDGGEEGDWRQASRSGPVWLRNLFARG